MMVPQWKHLLTLVVIVFGFATYKFVVDCMIETPQQKARERYQERDLEMCIRDMLFERPHDPKLLKYPAALDGERRYD